MNQEPLARRDELARVYQLGELLQQVAPRPFWQNNWRVQLSIGTMLALALFFLIISILAGIFAGGGAFIGFLILTILFGAISLLLFVTWRYSYFTSSGWVYVYTQGFVCLLKHRQIVARWEQLNYPGGVEVEQGYRNRGPSLHIHLSDGTYVDFESMWMDIKTLESLIQSTKSRSSPPPWQGIYPQGTPYYQHPPSRPQPPGPSS